MLPLPRTGKPEHLRKCFEAEIESAREWAKMKQKQEGRTTAGEIGAYVAGYRSGLLKMLATMQEAGLLKDD